MSVRVKLLAATAAISSAIIFSEANAALVTTDAGFQNKNVVDFQQQASSCTTYPLTSCLPGQDVGATVGEQIDFTGYGTVTLYNGYYRLAPNGVWDSQRAGYVAINYPSDIPPYATFTFQQGVSDVGAFMNYSDAGPDPVRIEALDMNGSVLESYMLAVAAPIVANGDNSGAFRGISRLSADIFGFRIVNAHAALDDLTFARPESMSEVPTPAAGIMLLTGLAGFAFANKREPA